MNTETLATINLENTSALTASYGTSSAGWATEEMNVRHLRTLLIQVDITWGDGAEILLKLQSSDPASLLLDADDYGTVCKVTTDGDVKQDILAIAKTDLPAGKYSFKVDVGSLSSIRMISLIDVATSSPTMTMALLAEFPDTATTKGTAGVQ